MQPRDLNITLSCVHNQLGVISKHDEQRVSNSWNAASNVPWFSKNMILVTSHTGTAEYGWESQAFRHLTLMDLFVTTFGLSYDEFSNLKPNVISYSEHLDVK